MVFFCLSCWIFYNLFLASSEVLYPLGTGTIGTRKQNHHHLQAKVVYLFSHFILIFSVVFFWKAFSKTSVLLESIQPAPFTGQAGLNSYAHLWVNYLSAGLSSPSAASFFPWFVSATREQAQNPGLKGDNGNSLCVLNEHTFFTHWISGSYWARTETRIISKHEVVNPIWQMWCGSSSFSSSRVYPKVKKQ